MIFNKANSRKLVSCIAILLISLSLFASIQRILPAFGTWWNHNWQFRKQITVDHTRVADDLTNFAMSSLLLVMSLLIIGILGSNISNH